MLNGGKTGKHRDCPVACVNSVSVETGRKLHLQDWSLPWQMIADVAELILAWFCSFPALSFLHYAQNCWDCSLTLKSYRAKGWSLCVLCNNEKAFYFMEGGSGYAHVLESVLQPPLKTYILWRKVIWSVKPDYSQQYNSFPPKCKDSMESIYVYYNSFFLEVTHLNNVQNCFFKFYFIYLFSFNQCNSVTLIAKSHTHWPLQLGREISEGKSMITVNRNENVFPWIL